MAGWRVTASPSTLAEGPRRPRPTGGYARRPVLYTTLAVGLGIALAVGATVYLNPPTPNACPATGPTMAAPTVGFTAPAVGPSFITFQVACASIAVSIDSYGLTLRHDSATALGVITLTAGNQTVTVGNDTFYVLFSDVNGDGLLKVQDAFRIGMANRTVLVGGSYDFYLVWRASGMRYPAVAWTV